MGRGAKAKKGSKPKPKVLASFEGDFPEIWKAYGWLRDACDHEGPLDPKTRELIKIGVETTRGGHGGMVAHIHRAERAGASREEILQAILLAGPLAGFPAVLDAYLVAKKHLG